MRRDLLIPSFIGLALVGVIGWAAREKSVENDRLYITPEEKSQRAVAEFHESLGELHGKIDRYHDEVDNLKNQLPEMGRMVGEAHGRVDTMREYFQKYSPEAFEKEVRLVRSEVSDLKSQLNDFSAWDERYARKWDMQQYTHLPKEWDWNQREKKIKATVEKLDNIEVQLTALLKTLVEKEVITADDQTGMTKASSKQSVPQVPPERGLPPQEIFPE